MECSPVRNEILSEVGQGLTPARPKPEVLAHGFMLPMRDHRPKQNQPQAPVRLLTHSTVP